MKCPAFIKKTWEKQDAASPLQWQKTIGSLAEALTKKARYRNKLEAKLTELENKPNTILLVTDVEALHPYLRIGSMESQLQGKFHANDCIFYPGIRTERPNVKFLGFIQKMVTIVQYMLAVNKQLV